MLNHRMLNSVEFWNWTETSMPDEEEEGNGPNGLPMPPPPPGINFPPPPPLPPPLPSPTNVASEPSPTEPAADDSNPAESSDFHSHWEKRKSGADAPSVESRESMYGHIDRLSSGQVGSLMDRFSDRFGSELDREIIVLRKKQQQDLLAIKPTVELISAPESEDEDTEEISEEDGNNDLFPEFFDVVNNLLGDMEEEFIDSFVSSDDFPLFQSVGESPSDCDEETRAEFFSMINRVLGELPEDKIEDFISSPGFEVYQKMGDLYS